jgi:hypothetical protein
MAKKQASAKASAPASHAPAELMPAENLGIDALVPNTDSTLVTSFLNSIVPFVRRATELETKAKGYQLEAKKLVAPANADEDARIQTFIRTGNAAKKTVEEHWKITAVISGIHRKLTAKRGVAVQALEDGAAIAQRLHNTYADNERRRAAEETERLRQAAEQKAREDRERELAQLEEQALKAEASTKDLSEREQAFVERVHAGVQPVRAAEVAGFKNATAQAARLMAEPKIVAALEAKRTAEAARTQAAARREQPLEVQAETVKPEIQKAGGFDRSTHSAEVVDELAFIMAAIGGKHGIPPDCLTVNTTKLNEYARSLQERIGLWPGIRHKKTTKTI